VLANADTDLAALAERLSQPDAPRTVSFCLFGPPGTGKSLFVRHLADRLGMELLERRASDLLSMWLGDTEQRIAAAFAEARRRQAFLVFNEADSLLGDRRLARRSWEISQVNEMLTWMEGHALPFACTTNLMERVDEAALRRFTFKLRLRHLAPPQARHAFRHFFGMDAPATLDGLSVLTPGDFATVRSRARFLGVAADAEALLALLREECALKPGCPKPVGFGAAL